eukprot:7391577-Prymnesium_polylepis.3
MCVQCTIRHPLGVGSVRGVCSAAAAVRCTLIEPTSTHARLPARKQSWASCLRSHLARAVSPCSTTAMKCGGQACAAAGTRAPYAWAHTPSSRSTKRHQPPHTRAASD